MFGSHIGIGNEVQAPAIRKQIKEVQAPAIRKQIKNEGKEDITESEMELTKNGKLPFEDIKNN